MTLSVSVQAIDEYDIELIFIGTEKFVTGHSQGTPSVGVNPYLGGG
jgi:hypothetical protein